MLTYPFMLERFPKLANGRCRCRRASWQGTGSTHLDSQLCCYPHIFTCTLTRSIICLTGFLIFLHRVSRMRYINWLLIPNGSFLWGKKLRRSSNPTAGPSSPCKRCARWIVSWKSLNAITVSVHVSYRLHWLIINSYFPLILLNQ